MKRVFRQWLAGLLSVVLVFTLLPAAALAEEADGPAEQTAVEQVQALIDALPDAEEITADNRADVQAQIGAIDTAMLELTEDQAAALDTARYDAAVAALLALDAPSALEQVQALIDELPDAAEITVDNRADVQVQIDAIDAAMAELTRDEAAALDTARYDAAVAALLALDAPSALEQVQALIDALPDAESITADNRADVEAQLTAIDEAKQDLTDDELDALDITRYMAAVEAILALDGMSGANEPETMDTDLNVGSEPVNIDTGGNYTITGSTTSNAITVNGGDVTITLNGVSVTKSNGCAFDIQSGNVTLILADGTTNSFTSSGIYAGIHVAQNASLTIKGNGTLYATATKLGDTLIGAGIGGDLNSNAGSITIESGTIVAKSEGDGAGIGGGHANDAASDIYGYFQSITIKGGKVTAESGGNGAGIGCGCWAKQMGTITISGGEIHAKTASSNDKACDIGYGHRNDDFSTGAITISGGVIFTEGSKNHSIGGSSVTKENCVIFPNSGSVEFKGNPTITGDVTIPSGKTLTVPSDQTLTVAEGAILTVAAGATLTNSGTIQNKGVINQQGTINGNEINGNQPVTYKLSVTAPNFNSLVEGYDSPAAQPITINNTGTADATISNVTVSGSDFTLVEGTRTVAVGGSNMSWKIQPKTRLVAGTHTATITVFYDGGGTATTNVSFRVDQAPIKYLDSGGREATCEVYTKVTNQSTWNTGWYVVSGDVTISNYITVNGTVHLILTDGHTLTAQKGIAVNANNSLTIYCQSGQSGKLSAVGDSNNAGIGSGRQNQGGEITINGGIITARGAYAAAGIGGGSRGSGGTITINGGNITAAGGFQAAGIGGGYHGSGTTIITINGGTITATAGSSGAAGIGKGESSSGSVSFSTGTDGNAVIVTTRITDTSQQNSWSGIIIAGDTGKVYGTPTPKYSFEIPSGKTLNVEDGHPLHIAEGITMTNKGTINIGTGDDMNAVLNNEGTIINEGTIDVWGQLTHGETGIKNQNDGEIVYHFNLDIEAPTFEEAQYGYSRPSPKTITIKNTGDVETTITSVEITGEHFEHNEGTTGGTLTKEQTNDSWTIQPKANLPVGEYTANITVTYSGNNGGASRTATALVTFTVTKANPTVTVSASGDPTYGSEITLTAEVTTATGVASNEINGEVTFKAGNVELGKARADNGTATLEIQGTDTVKQKAIFDNNEITAEYAGNDSIEENSGTGTVTVNPKTLTFTFKATDRTYDTTTKVEGSFDVNGKLDGDIVNVSDYTANVEDKDVGNAKDVTAAVTELGGDDAQYYEIGTVNGGTVDITQATLELTVAAVSITYGTKLTDGLLNGSTAKIQGTETTITGTFAWEDQNAVPTVSDSGDKKYKVIFTPTPPEKAGNFTADSLSTEITVTVSKATPTVTVQAVTGTYGDNITITAQVTVPGVDASLVTGTIQFEDGGTTLGTANVTDGTATLTVLGSEREKQHALFGASGSSTVTAQYNGNANIESGSDTGDATISQRTLEYTVTATNKVYDGNTKIAVSLSPANLVSGDNVSLTATGNVEKADAGEYETADLTAVAIVSASNGDGKYYSVAGTASGQTIQNGVTITKRVVTLNWKLDGDDTFAISYDGDSHTVIATVNNKALEGDEVGVTVEVKPDSGAGAGPYDATATDAGNYTATATELTGAAHGNYTLNGSTTATQAITISKVLATCTTPPTANENLTYTGEAQQLVTAGTTAGGTMMYALGENSNSVPMDGFSDAPPTGTDAKTYYVWYYVQGDGNHDDSAKKCVAVSIAKAEVTFTVSDNSYPYDGTEKKVTLGNSNTSDAPNLEEASDYNVTYGDDNTASKTDVGEYDIHIKLTEEAAKNYKFKDKGDNEKELTVEGTKLSIRKATSTVSDVTFTGTGEGITYGDTFTVSAKINAPGTVTGTVTFKAGETELGVATSIEGGVWKITVGANEKEKQHAIFDNKTISVEYSGDTNIEKSNGSKADITVAQKPLTYTVTAEGREWNGETGVVVALAATNTVSGDVVTLTATGNLDNDGKAGTYSAVNLSEVQIDGADKDYYTTEETKDNVELTANIVIEKAESSVTAPVGKSGLTYTGNPQGLIDEATDVVDGTVKYFVGAKAPDDGASEWKTEVDQITGTNAGTYKVWYYVDGDENHNDSTPASVEVTIDPAEVSFTIGAENKDDWGTKGETNTDPNPTGYTLGGSGTDYKLSMIYDSYGHKANVIQTAGEAVKIEAGDANGFTVTYKKDGTGPDLPEITDAGTYDIIVNLTPAENTEDVYNFQFDGQGSDVRSLKIGTVTVTPFTVHVTWSHLKYIYHAHPMHPTVKVQNAFNSDVQPTTVPEDFDPEAGYDGKLLAYAVTNGSDVGDYEVTVTLYGTSAGNYTVEDTTETVSILAAPVTFTVGDNIWDITKELIPTKVTLRAAWGEVTTTPDVAVHHKYPGAGTKLDVGNLNTTIEYRRDGLTYSAPDNPPTEAGIYEVWVKIGNENYRHSATDSGDFHKVGELILTDNPDSIRSYTITFDSNYEGASNGPAKMEKIFEKQTVIIPSASGVNEDGTEYDITRESYRFLGWSYGGRTYQPNEEFIMPASDVTFKAEWVLAVDVSGTVKQGEDESTAKALPGATVTLKNGAEEVAETTTDNQGNFKLEQVAPGIYNLEIRYQSGSTEIIKTFLVEVGENGSLDGTYLLPTVALNTVVEVTPGITAAVDMGGIVSGEDITDVYTPDDRETVRDGGTVEFRMSIQSGTLTPDQAEEVPVPEDRIGMVLDLELTKTVTKSGTGSTETDIHDTKIPVTTVIHLPAELQGKSSYTIYRFHDMENEEDSETLEMQTITTSPNNDGEYLKIVRDGTAIEIHAEFYSTYVLTWQQSSGGGGISRYPVNLPSETDDGTITSNPTSAIPGSRVTLTAKPDEGYHIGFLTVTDRNGKPVELTDKGDGTYTFTQPYGQVTVKVEFMKCGSLDFTDLDTKAWYHDYTDYVIAHGLMQGTGGGLFDPDGIVNRAQMVTVLWNMSGKPVVNYYMTYSDVSEDAWYSEAIRWATSEGIAGGYGNGKFGPNDSITREQMTTMIYRYEQKYGDGGFTGDWMYRLPFKDLDQISDWAFEAVAWCNVKGVITGKGNNIFDPKGFAKRSEMAAILTRFCKEAEK